MLRVSAVNSGQAENFLAFLGKKAGAVWGGQALRNGALWLLSTVRPVPLSGLPGELGTARREGVFRNI